MRDAVKAEYILHRLREDLHDAVMGLFRLAEREDYDEAMRACREARATLERELEMVSFAEALADISASGDGGVDRAIEVVDRLLSRLLLLLSDLARRGDPKKAAEALEWMEGMVHNAQLDVWRYKRIADGRLHEAQTTESGEASDEHG